MSDKSIALIERLTETARNTGEPVEYEDDGTRMMVHPSGNIQPVTVNRELHASDSLDRAGALPMQERQWDNFDQSAQQNWFLESKAKGSEVEDGSSLIDQVIEVRWFLIHEVEFSPDEHGEISSAYRTVLITPEFRCIQFVSDGVLKSMNIAIRRMGKKTFDPALKVVVKQITTRSKRKMLVLDPVFEN